MSRKPALWPALTIIVLTLSAISFTFARNKLRVAADPPKLETALPQKPAPEFKQRLRVFVHKNDIRPRALHAWPGKAVLSVENESQADVSLQIERVLANRTESVGAVSLSARGKRLPQEVTLVAGEYVLYEVSRPNNRLSLIVEPRQ